LSINTGKNSLVSLSLGPARDPDIPQGPEMKPVGEHWAPVSGDIQYCPPDDIQN
jgi:hypothetical protein